MESIEDSFTSNEEISEYAIGDITISLKGYVDAIEGSKSVSEGKKILFKIIVNKAKGKRVRVLFWNELAKKYSAIIRSHNIISIKKAFSRIAQSSYSNSNVGVNDIELSVGNNSIINIEGVYEIDHLSHQFMKVEFSNLNRLKQSLFKSEAYIKEIFTEMNYNGASFGSGVLTDGTYRVRVQIESFDSKVEFKEGDHVEIEGEIRTDKYNVIIIFLKNMDSMKKTFKLPLSSEELKLGYRTLKRLQSPLEIEDYVPPEKKQKLFKGNVNIENANLVIEY